MANGEGAAPLYEITSQAETYDRGANGQFSNGVQVSFRTRSGAQGSVFVPYAEYTIAAVRQRVTERATAMEAVQNLGGEG